MIEQLKEILMMSDIECQNHILKVLGEEGYTINIGHDPDKISANYIFAYPKNKEVVPVLLMAHWDTVRQKTGKVPDEPIVLVEENGRIENGSGILGADDRAGIGMILEAQNAFDTKPMLLFTNYEETGGYGMKTFIESKLLDPFRNIINLAVSVDRKGHNQWVCYYNNDDYDLEEFMLRLGYVEEVGSWTDGAGLAAAYNLPHVNVSYGGYLPHSTDEFLLKDSYINGVDRLVSLIENCTYKFERKIRHSTSSYYKSYKSQTKSTTITPADNAGKGTAAYDNIPSDAVIMTADDEELELHLGSIPCEICGRDDGTASFNLRSRVFMCPKCINRIMDKYGEMSPETALAGIRDLEQEKKRTREVNVLLKPKEHINKNFPSCPVCGKKDHVSWSKKTAGFVCTECSLAHSVDEKKFPFNGKFWAISKDNSIIKMYEKEDTVYEVNENNTKILRTVPILEHNILKKCSKCGAVGTVMTEYEHNFYLCRSCSNELGDLVDDWEDSRKTDIVGSEDLPF